MVFIDGHRNGDFRVELDSHGGQWPLWVFLYEPGFMYRYRLLSRLSRIYTSSGRAIIIAKNGAAWTSMRIL